MVIAQPEVIQNYLFPLSEQLKMKILEYRSLISSHLTASVKGDAPKDKTHKLLIIAGPRAIRSPIQAKYCSQWISKMFGKRSFTSVSPNLQMENTNIFTSPRNKAMNSLVFAMKANVTESLERDDVHKRPMMSGEVYHGIPLTRTLMHELAQFCPLTVYLSNTITPQYISDLCCLGLIEKSLVECQLNREIVSGVSYPVGFETDLDSYKIAKAGEAILASTYPHSFLTVTKNGTVAHVETCGNEDTFLVISMDLNMGTNTEIRLQDDEVYELTDDTESLLSLFQDFHLDIATMSIEEMEDLIVNFRTLLLSMKDQSIKVMFDMGDLKYSDYKHKAQMIYSLIMDDSIYERTVGFIVNSGDFYLPEGIELVEEDNEAGFQGSSCLSSNAESTTYQFNNLKNNLMNHKSCYKVGFDALPFKLANQLIELIAEFNYSRSEYKSRIQSSKMKSIFDGSLKDEEVCFPGVL